MKGLCKKILIAIMIAAIFTAHVPAISSIVWAIEDSKTEEKEEKKENSTDEKIETEVDNETKKDNAEEDNKENNLNNNENTNVVQYNKEETNMDKGEIEDENINKEESDISEGTLRYFKSTPNEIVELDEKIKNALIERGVEPGEDGNFSKEELSNEDITYLNIECNSEEIELTGIENILNLEIVNINNLYGTIDVYNLSNLPKLRTLSISGNVTSIENLELLTNLTSLSCYFYGNFVNLNVDISEQVEKLTNLERFTIEGDYILNFSKITKLSKLEYLSVGNSYNNDAMLDCESIGQLLNLKNLQIRYYELNNLKGLEKLTNLKDLNLTIRYNESVDIDTITKIQNLENLYLDGIDASNIEWLKSIQGLKLLSISNYNDSNNFSEDFFDNLNDLNVEKIELYGSCTFNIGKVEVDKENEFDLNNIPWIKEITNQNSKLYIYTDKINFNYSDYYENENNVRFDNENSKMYFTPRDDTNRYAYIYGESGINIKIEWQTDSDSNVPELSEKLKQALINNSYDTNHDGKLTIAELNNEQNTYLSIYFNNNEKVDLTGIEYVKNLYSLSISCYDKIDFTNVSKLKNLRNLSMNGKCDTSTLYLLSQLNTLSLSMYSSDIAANLDDLKDLKNLSNLSLYGLNDVSISSINSLSNLNQLDIHFKSTTKINANEISNLNNLYSLKLYNIDASDLNGLEKLKSLIDLSIEQATGYYDEIDKVTLQKLENLETLSMIATKDLSWINNIKNLHILDIKGGNSYYGIELTQDYLNDLKNISAKVVFNGSFSYNIGNIEVGNEIDKNINEIPVIKELIDSNSKLCGNNVNINSSSYGENNYYKYDAENQVLKIKVNEVSEYSVNLNINYSTNNRYGYLYLRLKWNGYVNGDNTKIINIKDNNFKKELLENYDIDDDKQITEHDMINISELSVINKDISDITGIENATNIKWFDLSNNQISDLSPLINLMNRKECWGYVNNNYVESLEGLENLNFSNLDLSNNYIDFSDNSNNMRILEEYITKKANEDFENDPELAENMSKDQYINNMKSRILSCYKIQKYGSVAERNDVLEFEQPLFDRLNKFGFDANNDGNITKGELSEEFINQYNQYYEELDLSNLGISNIENLKYLANVRTINLSGNNITDISPLKEVKDLYEINLNNNNIENTECIRDFFNVSTLCLANNKIKDITPLQDLRKAKVVYMGEGIGLFAGGMEPYRTLTIDLSNNEIEDISVINNIVTLSTINLSGNKITDISSLSNYDFDALYVGFEEYLEYEYFEDDTVTINVTKNYIDANDNKNLEAINHFQSNNSKIEIGDQYIKLTDNESNITIETYGETTAKIKVEEIEKEAEKPEEVSQKIGDMEILYAADISIIDGEYSGKITVTIPLDSKLNGLQVKVIHQKENGTVEEFNKTVKNASVSLEVDELSPFYIAYDKKQNKKGDINGDGKVTLIDYGLVLAHVKRTKLLEGEQLARADVNGDSRVTLIDYGLILAHVKRTKLLF